RAQREALSCSRAPRNVGMSSAWRSTIRPGSATTRRRSGFPSMSIRVERARARAVPEADLLVQRDQARRRHGQIGGKLRFRCVSVVDSGRRRTIAEVAKWSAAESAWLLEPDSMNPQCSVLLAVAASVILAV